MIKLTILFCYIKNVLYVLRNCSNIIIYYRRVVYNYITGVMRIMKKFQKLSDTEMEIMTIIWGLNKEVTSAELLNIIEKEKGKRWSGQTIATFLT